LDEEKSFIKNTLEAAVAERYYMCDKLFMTGEARVTNSWVRVPVVLDQADVTNAALHLIA